MKDSKRPYDGQPHTHLGERGKTVVKGLTMRDIADCIEEGQRQATKPGDRIDYDELAVIQSALCAVEKKMGIYPNTGLYNPHSAEGRCGCFHRRDEHESQGRACSVEGCRCKVFSMRGAEGPSGSGN